jgi:hypothetical protein
MMNLILDHLRQSDSVVFRVVMEKESVVDAYVVVVDEVNRAGIEAVVVVHMGSVKQTVLVVVAQ